jgi:error-prone DNA polymerase
VPIAGPLQVHSSTTAADLGLPTIATNAVHMHHPARFRLAGALAAVRANRSLDEIAGWLPASGGAHLRSGAEQTERFARYPGILDRTAALGRELTFDLSLVAPSLPPFRVLPGHNEVSYLRHLTLEGARARYGPKADNPQAYHQIEHELAVITELGFPGYFLVVWDIVRFCRDARIFCQGRGSAANSAVCYALGITNADPVKWKLRFERFLTGLRQRRTPWSNGIGRRWTQRRRTAEPDWRSAAPSSEAWCGPSGRLRLPLRTPADQLKSPAARLVMRCPVKA